MPEQKVKFTVWLDPAVLQAAKARAGRTGESVSEVLAHAARETLLGRAGDNGTGDILKAVDRVFYQVQRAERRRGFDQDVLKEMLGLAVLSFFNHTPAVPESEKRAALVSGKTRFGRFLDTLADNLRGGRSILHDLPSAVEGAPEAGAAQNKGPVGATADAEGDGSTAQPIPSRSNGSIPEKLLNETDPSDPLGSFPLP